MQVTFTDNDIAEIKHLQNEMRLAVCDGYAIDCGHQIADKVLARIYNLCEDEGCPHAGIEHVCRTVTA